MSWTPLDIEDRLLRKTPAIMLIIGIFLGTYLTFLLYSNYKTQQALNSSALESAQLNFEKYVGDIEYFFSERKHDLLYLTNSTEINGYFINKSLGMSEAYGLKLNAYLVKSMLKTNVESKAIQEKHIYTGFTLFDANGKILVETQNEKKASASYKSFITPSASLDDVDIQVVNGDDGYQVILRNHCYLKGKIAGELVAFLNFDTFATYFLKSLAPIDDSNLAIVNSNGNEKTIIFTNRELLVDEKLLTKGDILEYDTLANLPERLSNVSRTPLLAVQKKISHTPFKLVFIVELEKLIKQSIAWQIVTGAAGLIIIFLFSFFIIFQFRIKNKILHSNVVKIEKQQAALENKNAQLQKEIADKKEAEREKRKIEHRLHQAKKMEGVGQLAAGIAHDLNNILSGIVSLPQLLMMQLPEGSPLKPYLMTIEKSGNHAAMIVKDMLTLSKGALEMEDIVNLGDVVDEFLKSPERQKLSDTHPGVRLKTNIDKNIHNIKGSSIHLLKLLMNIVNNGADAIKEEGQIEISLQNISINSKKELFKDVQPGEYVHLSVRDTGIGILKKDLKRMFEPFYSSKTLGRKGSGLGMVIVWNTVKEHDGSIFIESEVEKGTTIHVCFPKTEEQISYHIPDSKITPISGNGESILIVDDTQVQLDIARAILESLNYSVTTVNNGVEAVERYASKQFDLILLDMMMEPGISGLETTKRILSKFPDAQIIIASGYSESGMVRNSIALGARQFIQKPYSVNSLSSTIHEILSTEAVKH